MIKTYSLSKGISERKDFYPSLVPEASYTKLKYFTNPISYPSKGEAVYSLHADKWNEYLFSRVYCQTQNHNPQCIVRMEKT